jgi:PHD/YefM family antitoxin component YafN of YafNO toxin-antitoxin module
MKEETTTVRNFLRNYKSFVSKKNTVIVANHGVPEVVFVPYSQWKREHEEKSKKKNLRQIPIRELIKGLTFKSDDPNLSQNIDKILYEDFKN